MTEKNTESSAWSIQLTEIDGKLVKVHITGPEKFIGYQEFSVSDGFGIPVQSSLAGSPGDKKIYEKDDKGGEIGDDEIIHIDIILDPSGSHTMEFNSYFIESDSGSDIYATFELNQVNSNGTPSSRRKLKSRKTQGRVRNIIKTDK